MRRLQATLWLLLGATVAQELTEEELTRPGRVYEVHPQGGPVKGDVALTVYGEGLRGVECVFGLVGPGRPTPQRSTCRFSEANGDAGRRCFCTAPQAPRDSTTSQSVGPNGQIVTTTTYSGEYQKGPVEIRAIGQFGYAWAPWDATFIYYALNQDINITSIHPTAGNPNSYTVVTVHGHGFRDYGGVYCSYPGALWNELMQSEDPDYEWYAFASPGTLVSENLILCNMPPKGNNSSPVFLEVCLNGHPDLASPSRRARRDSFCTSSLNRFDYQDQTNLTIWNQTVRLNPFHAVTSRYIAL